MYTDILTVNVSDREGVNRLFRLLDNFETHNMTVCVVGASCVGKSTLIYEYDKGVDMDVVLFGDEKNASILTKEEVEYACSDPWTPEIGEFMNQKTKEYCVPEIGSPVFGTVCVPADILIYIYIDNSILAERIKKRNATLESVLDMKASIEMDIQIAALQVCEALVVVDVQEGCVNEEWPEWELILNKVRECVSQIEDLIVTARDLDIEIIWIRSVEWKKDKLQSNLERAYLNDPDVCFYNEGLKESVIPAWPNERVFYKNHPSIGVNSEFQQYISQKCTVGICGIYSTGCVNSCIEITSAAGCFNYVFSREVETFDSKRNQQFQEMLKQHWHYLGIANVLDL